MSRELVERVAIERNAYLPIVMSTVEAESNFRNIIGQYAAESARWGAGFGQVHPAWHPQAVRDVANRLGVALPPDFAGIPWRTGDQVWDRFRRGDRAAKAVRDVIDNVILRNDLFSAHLAVDVIMSTWNNSGRDFDRFVAAYVGPAIPVADRERRRRKLERWRRHYGGERPQLPQQPQLAPVLPPEPIIGVYPDGDGYVVRGGRLGDLQNIGFALGALSLGVLMLYAHRQAVAE